MEYTLNLKLKVTNTELRIDLKSGQVFLDATIEATDEKHGYKLSQKYSKELSSFNVVSYGEYK